MTLLKKCDKLSKSVFTDPRHHCASRGNAVPVSRTPPESESHARARVTPESQHFWNDALSPASQLRSKMRWCQQHHQNLLGGKPTTPQGMQKPFPCILETCEKHVFLLSLRLTEKIVADSPSLRLCVLIGCWKIALLRLPKVQLWDTKPVTWRQWTPATSSDCRPETSCCASFPCSLWTIEIKH